MTVDHTVSVVMAVYNGGTFLKEQIDSILPQLRKEDELIISYDNSEDDTLKIIESYEISHDCVRVVRNSQKGVVSNFENGLREASNDIIFLSDQDDIWSPRKIEKMLACFARNNVLVAIHDCSLIDEYGNEIYPSTFNMRWGNTSVIRNLIRLSYIGCSMAFRRDMLKVVLPIPTRQRSHDWWIGTVTSLYGRMEKIDEVLVHHRMHNDNVTPKSRPSVRYQIEVRFLIASNAIRRKLNKWKR